MTEAIAREVLSRFVTSPGNPRIGEVIDAMLAYAESARPIIERGCFEKAAGVAEAEKERWGNHVYVVATASDIADKLRALIPEGVRE